MKPNLHVWLSFWRLFRVKVVKEGINISVFSQHFDFFIIAVLIILYVGLVGLGVIFWWYILIYLVCCRGFSLLPNELNVKLVILLLSKYSTMERQITSSLKGKENMQCFLFHLQHIGFFLSALFHPYFHHWLFYMHANTCLFVFCIDVVLLWNAITWIQPRGAEITINVLLRNITEIIHQNCEV